MARCRLSLLALLLIVMTALSASPHRARAGDEDLYGDTAGHPPQFIGIARDIKSLKPLPGVFVLAKLKDTNYHASTFSDEEGRFRIEGFPDGFDPGAVEFTCTKAGYKMVKTLTRKISPDPNTPVEVECLNERP